jgi:hypothetical protein
MAIVQISKIQVKTGNIADLPQLSPGEFGWAIDSKQLFIGNDPNVVGPIPDNTEILTENSTLAAAGNPGEIQFNDNGTFGASPNLTWDNANANFTVDGNVAINGDVDINGNIIYIDIEKVSIQDPIIELGNGPNNAPLTANNGFDRGLLLHNYTTQPVDAFMGWNTSQGEFELASNVSISNDVVTVNEYGNVKANIFTSMSGLFLNTSTISSPYIVPVGYNAMSAGPLTIIPGGSVVVTSSRWTVL